jgi:hypothetical protein
MIRRTPIQLKPGVPRYIHLLLAACLWSIAGIFLMTRGMSWLMASEKLWLALPAVIAGSLKSYFLLDNSARKGVYRILALADGTCLGAVYSIKTWLLVLVMIGSGVLLRHSSLPRELLGAVYMTIGWALFFSSRFAWQAWRSLLNQQKHQ